MDFRCKRIIYFLLIVITIIGFLKRIDYSSFDLREDTGRDLFIAKSFFSAENNNYFIRPTSTLFGLPNTPFYFWTISFFYLISQSLLGVILIHSLLQSLLIPIAFFSIKKIGNEKLGIMASIFVAFSPTLIYDSLHMRQFSLIPVFIALSFMFLVRVKQQNNTPKSIYLSIAAFIPALLLHNSAIPLFIGFSFVWVFLAKKYGGKKYFLATIILIILSTITYLILAYQFDFWLFNNLMAKIFIPTNGYPSYMFINRLVESLKILWANLYQPFANNFVLLIILVMIFRHKKNLSSDLIPFLPILGILLSILVPMEQWSQYYITSPYLILLIFLISFLPSFLKKRDQIIVITLLTCNFLFNIKGSILQFGGFQDPFLNLKKTSEIITKSSTALKTDKKISIIMPQSDRYNLPHLSEWFSPSSFLFLDNKHLPHFSLVDSQIAFNNILFQSSKENTILVCINDKNIPFFSLDNCVNDWKTMYNSRLTKIGIFSDNEINYYFFESQK